MTHYMFDTVPLEGRESGHNCSLWNVFSGRPPAVVSAQRFSGLEDEGLDYRILRKNRLLGEEGSGMGEWG